MAGLAAITMLFAALLSAYVVRRGMSTGWTPAAIPFPLYASVLPALASSMLAELGRKRRQASLMAAAALTGLAFAAIQAAGWRELATNRTAATDFLLLLSALMAAFATGGAAALLIRRSRPDTPVYYWRYLNLLWIAILAFVRLAG